MILIHDHFQNYKRYNIPKAQIVIADIPYNVGINAYASNPQWYRGGDLQKGQSELAGKQFFDTDKDFRIPVHLKIKLNHWRQKKNLYLKKSKLNKNILKWKKLYEN